MDTNTRIHPETGEILRRDVRPEEFSYKGESIIVVDVPGWYPADNNNGIFSREDSQITINVLRILKERVRMREEAAQNVEDTL